MTWSVLARVDGQTYSLFGVPLPGEGVQAATLEGGRYTATHTIFTLTAGAATFELDFFSPVSPQNYLRQSLPFSYLTVSTSGRDGATPDVQIYSDIDNSWAGQYGRFIGMNWGWGLTGDNIHVFTLSVIDGQEFVEVNDRAQWGTAFYSTQHGETNVTDKLGIRDDLRDEFAANGTLLDVPEWSWGDGSVVAYTHSLGPVGPEPRDVRFVVGYSRGDAEVNYMGERRAGYWRGWYGDVDGICFRAFDDYPSAHSESLTFDRRIVEHADPVGGSNYSDIVSLSTRQMFGAIDITISADTFDIYDPLAFVKEISSNGNTNTVDVIFPFAPILYIMNPDLIRVLLEPIMRYLDTGSWPHDYMIHDLGTHYPNATGHNDGEAEPMPLEECGNIILLVYMYQLGYGQAGEGSWQETRGEWLRRSADYLVANGLYPTAQLSSDDGAGVVGNQTGLAIKAAIALNAYGKMTEQPRYSDIGLDFAHTLFEDGAGTDEGRTHFTLQQGDDDSWSLAYNLYSDLLLNLNTFPPAAYAMQSTFYPSVRTDTAVPLDSKSGWAKTDWLMYAAACAMAPDAEDASVKEMFVNDVHALLSSGRNEVPFSDNYYTETVDGRVEGNFNLYKARPVVGGHYALMALGGPGTIAMGDGGKGR